MANKNQIALLKKGVDVWNAWRAENRDIQPDLSGVDLPEAKLNKANLSGADLRGATLTKANLNGADLSAAKLVGAELDLAALEEANLSAAELMEAGLQMAKLYSANLTEADLRKTNLNSANLLGANCRGADLREADLTAGQLLWANLSEADLRGARLIMATPVHANLAGANLARANLSGTNIMNADITEADLTGCRIYGVAAWGLKLAGAKQQNLVITRTTEPEITVDNIEVAQFIYLLLHNEKIRDVIDTVTSKAVLVLGRFTDERKPVLDAIRDELRKRNYLPILFDFAVPARQNITETVTLLARMARFIIADLTDPSSIPQELQAIIPSVRVPVQPLLLEGSSHYSMFKDFDPQDFHWVLPVYQYKKTEQLIARLEEKVISPAERKVKALEDRRHKIEAELNKPQ